MAIKIPSNKIFSIDNEKIRDNIIERAEMFANNTSVEVEANNLITLSNQRPNAIAPESDDIYRNGEDDIKDWTNDYICEVRSGNSKWAYILSTLIRSYKIATIYMRIPKKQKDKCVSNINYGGTDYSNSEIKWSVSGKKTTYNILEDSEKSYCNYTYDALGGFLKDIGYHWKIEDNPVKEEYAVFPFEDTNSETVEYDTNGVKKTAELYAKASIFVPQKYIYIKELQDGVTDDYPSVLAPYIYETTSFISLKFFIPVSYEIFKPKFNGFDLIATDTVFDAKFQKGIIGTQEEYEVENVAISIYGTTFTLKLDEEKKTIGDTNATSVYSESSNELIQSDNYYVDKNNENSHKNLVEKNCENIIKEYKNGKETATIKCTISDYYDEFGEKEKDITNPEKMIFNIGDEVIPYYPVYGGGEKPISYYDDKKTPKVFKVVNRKLSYKGAPFQTITIQEILKN